MKTLISTLFISSVTAVALSAAVIPAASVKGDLAKADTKGLKFVEVVLYPQLTVGNNDKLATATLGKEKPKKVMVAALQNGKDLELVVKWPDGTKSIQSAKSNTSYGDGFAVQFPKTSDDVSKLPYIGMGSEGRSVVVHLQKAVEGFYEPNGGGNVEMQQHKDNWNLFRDDLAKRQKEVAAMANKDYQKTFVAEGFRSMTEVRDAKGVTMEMAYDGKGWTGTLIRPLKDDTADLSRGVMPVAVAVWDGANANRDGAKLLSAWVPVKVGNDKKTDDAVALITKESKGNAANGKKIADEQCAACHIYPGSAAMANMAPNLTHIGGYSNYSYLKESILTPSAAVVPGYNRNAHPNTPWYNLNDKGQRESTMPPYEGVLNDSQIDDVIAFLQTLKGGK